VPVEFAQAEYGEAELVVIERQRSVDALDIQYEVGEKAFH
jgi:hypothetical protein